MQSWPDLECRRALPTGIPVSASARLLSWENQLCWVLTLVQGWGSGRRQCQINPSGLGCHIWRGAAAINVPLARGQRWARPTSLGSCQVDKTSLLGNECTKISAARWRWISRVCSKQRRLYSAAQRPDGLCDSSLGFWGRIPYIWAGINSSFGQLKSHHYTLPTPVIFAVVLQTEYLLVAVRVKAAFWNLPALYPFCCTPAGIQKPNFFSSFPAGYKQLLFWKERLCTIVILLSNL